jgi:DNA-binding phage protein
MSDVTKNVAEFVRDKGFPIKTIAKRTGISSNVLYKSFSGSRKLRADEYLVLCEFLGKDPKDFGKNRLIAQ